MSLLAVYLCRRLKYNSCNSASHTIRQYSNVSDNEPTSVKFPDYKIIYTFPYISYPYFFNKLKRNATIGTGIFIPLIPILGITNVISLVDSSILLGTFCLTTGLLHCSSYWCNNFIGSIYFKEDTQKVIISYINYWGKRIDLERNVNNIIPLTETPMFRGPILYRILQLEAYDKKLKLYLKSGKIHRELDFVKVFGSTN